MAEKKQKTTQQKSDVVMEVGSKKTFKRSDNFASLYVNSTVFGFTRWDFQMMMGHVEVSRDASIKDAKEVAVITMTPAYAKALLIDFAKVMDEFESKHGAIDVSLDFTEEIAKTTK
jgi:hypothetical protein